MTTELTEDHLTNSIHNFEFEFTTNERYDG